jgi:PAN domain
MTLQLSSLRSARTGMLALAVVMAAGVAFAADAPRTLGAEPQQIDGFTVREGYDQLGHTFSTQPAPTADACLALCKENERCLAYTFEVKREKCHLKDAPNLMRPSPGKVTGARQKES